MTNQAVVRLVQWIHGQCHLQACEYLKASSVFNQLRENSVLKDDVTNLVSHGTTLFLAGDYTNALQPLQRYLLYTHILLIIL